MQVVLKNCPTAWNGQYEVKEKSAAVNLEEISDEMGDKVKIAKVNIDENQDIAAKYGIRSIPTMLMFKDGEVISTKVGAAPKASLSSWISGEI